MLFCIYFYNILLFACFYNHPSLLTKNNFSFFFNALHLVTFKTYDDYFIIISFVLVMVMGSGNIIIF